jgi:predicted DNA-binding transcriptional regulator AlpA
MKHENPDRLLRLREILAPNGPIPVGKSTWWAGVRTGRFPPPLKLGPRTTVWRLSDIQPLIDCGVPQFSKSSARRPASVVGNAVSLPAGQPSYAKRVS